MQQEFTERSNQVSQQASPVSTQSSQDGIHHHDLAGRLRQPPVAFSPRSVSPASSHSSSRSSRRFDHAHSDHGAHRLSQPSRAVAISTAAGKRISDYENSMLSSSPKRPLGFKVTKNPDGTDVSLPELPDEVWEHVMSKLDPRTHHAIAKVSQRFRRLASTQRTWKMAFMNHFPGQKGLAASSDKDENQVTWYDDSAPGRPSVRFFARLSQMCSWREEYALRTSLLRSLSRGKAESDFQACSASHKDKTQHFPTLTYWPKLNRSVTHLDASFSDDPEKPPLAIHGSAASGQSSIAVPLSGKVVKPAGFELSSYQMWTHYTPNSVPYGLGEGPVFMPNVMDVSQRFGSASFESFPGGIGGYLSPTGETLWLGFSHDLTPTGPRVSRDGDCVTAAWIAKSNAIPTLTRGKIGILSGSAMGFVSGYSFQRTVATVPGMPPRSQSECVSWAVSPGIPIVALEVDEEYSQKRASAGQAWAVALNALGEVFTLTDIPDFRPPLPHSPWEVGCTASWCVIPSTRRRPRLDDLDGMTREKVQEITMERVFSPGPLPARDGLTEDEFTVQALKIDKFCQLPPSHFRNICLGWDMRRRLEVDFAAGDGDQSLEQVFVITCGHDMNEGPPSICRYTRRISPCVSLDTTSRHVESIFGSPDPSLANVGTDPTPSGGSAVRGAVSGSEWLVDSFSLESQKHQIITASALDMSNLAVLAVGEEDLDPALVNSALLPGRRGRWLAIGTDSGVVVIWNGRSAHGRNNAHVRPLRHIQTDSPEISCLAVTSLCVVHGGSDGRLQAWDPLGSTLDSVRILNAKQKGSPLRATNVQQMLTNRQPAVRAIYLDPDPTKLRGLASYGRVVRCWSYSATNHVASRKRRHRFVDSHGRYVGRRQGSKVAGYIGAEQEELERERRDHERDRKYLQNHFMLADLTEDEAILYAQILSEEAAQQDELRRTTDQDTSTSDSVSLNETESDAPSIFVSNDPGVGTPVDIAGPSNQHSASLWVSDNTRSRDDESDSSAREMELAIRLSLQDVDSKVDESSQAEASSFTADGDTSALPNGDDEVSAVLASISEEEDVELRKALLASLQESRQASQSRKETVNGASAPITPPNVAVVHSEDEDLKMALEMSRQEDEINCVLGGHAFGDQDFPDLGGGSSEGKGKGKSRGDTSGSAGKGKRKGKWVKWSP